MIIIKVRKMIGRSWMKVEGTDNVLSIQMLVIQMFYAFSACVCAYIHIHTYIYLYILFHNKHSKIKP